MLRRILFAQYFVDAMNSLMAATPTEHSAGAKINAESAEMTTKTVTEETPEKI